MEVARDSLRAAAMPKGRCTIRLYVHMTSLGWDFWTARLSKLETRGERDRLSISTPPKETSNEHRVASNRSRGRAYGFAPRRRSSFQIVGASGMGQDERLR